jgi:hypothetical protein
MQYLVIAHLGNVPPLGAATPAKIFRAEADSEAAAVEAAAQALAALDTARVLVVPSASLIPYRIDVSHSRTVVAE